MEAWLGLGSNLRNPLAQVRTALNSLDEIDGIGILKVSSFYQTPPWGDEKQDDFVNAVVKTETSLTPLSLLHVLQSIENEMGRQRNDRRWGPRLIDIDLLLYGDLICHSDELEIPHPRMHERAFVLAPLSEIDPSLTVPGHGKVETLLSQLDHPGFSRLVDDGPQ